MLGPFPLTRSETGIEFYHQKVNIRIFTGVAKRLKTYNHGQNI